MSTLKTSGVKGCVASEHSPSPYQYLASCCYQCQLLGLTTTYKALVESSQGVVSTNTTQGTHIQSTSQRTIALTGDPGFLMDAAATLVGSRVQSQVSHQTPGISFAIRQDSPAMQCHQDVKDVPLSYARYSQQEFLLFAKMRISLQMVLDGFLYNSYSLFQRGDGLRHILTHCFMGVNHILSGVSPVLLLLEHVFQVILPVQKMLQLLHFHWQRLPWERVLRKGIVSQVFGILWVGLGSFACGFCPLLWSQGIGQTHPPSLLIGEVGKGLLIATCGFHHHMHHGGINLSLLFFYPSSYGLETIRGIGELSYEDRLILKKVSHIQILFANVYANTQFLHGIISLVYCLGFSDYLVCGLAFAAILNSLRLPRQLNLSTHEFHGFHDSWGNVNGLLEIMPEATAERHNSRQHLCCHKNESY